MNAERKRAGREQRVSTATPEVREVCEWGRRRISAGAWLLLEDVVDQDLKEDEESDDDEVALLEERAALDPARRAAPQHADAPANRQWLRVRL